LITAVDTSALLAVFAADPRYGPGTREALRECIQRGSLVACAAVWAELAAAFPFPSEAQAAMDRLGVTLSPMKLEASLEAGKAWKMYHAAGANRPKLPVAAFLVGSHALHQADRLLTTERELYRSIFPGLPLVVPALRQARRTSSAARKDKPVAAAASSGKKARRASAPPKRT
jgi:predicted nucleic acid-binding protein